MAYPNFASETFAEDAVRRKEIYYFRQHIPDGDDNRVSEVDQAISRGRYLIPTSYQMLAQNYVSPNNRVNRTLIKYGTGTGKTITSIRIALQFIAEYRQRMMAMGTQDVGTKPIIIIGFTKNIFREEMLRYPELGFVTREEVRTLQELKHTALRGIEEDVARYNEYRIRLRRRITSGKGKGRFQFYGYREFVNRIFEGGADISGIDEKTFCSNVEDGTIRFNEALLSTMQDGLIICDEIHNVYNACEKNNWGIAIALVLKHWGNRIRAVFLSATPINHQPTEVVDLVNLLHVDHQYKRTDFFREVAGGGCKYELRDDFAKRIGVAVAGRVLFLEDADPRYFPRSMLDGDQVNGVPVLKFVRTKMSKFHTDTFRQAIGDRETLPVEAQYLVDLVLPNPASKTIGLYSPTDVKNVLTEAPSKWLATNNIEVVVDDNGVIVSGEFLQRKTLARFSSKYARMVDDVHKALQDRIGKVFIYHRYVRMSGVMFIREIFIRNGFIDETSAPTDTTLDVITGLTMAIHKKKKVKTEFRPARFIVVHSEIDLSTRDANIERFNAPSNARGEDIMLIIGAEVIKESYDIKCVRETMIMSRPDNIPTLVQIFGRTRRKGSHIDLPPDMRTVRYRIYVSETDERRPKIYEVDKYADKIVDYQVIQRIERVINSHAIDADINMRMIRTTFVREGELGVLLFSPIYGNVRPRDLKLGTFATYYREQEVSYVIYTIKRLLIETSPVWTYDDLAKAVRSPPFALEIDASIISEDSIRVALRRLEFVTGADDVMVNPTPASVDFIDRIRDADDRVIPYKNNEYVIRMIGKYYVLARYDRVANTAYVYPETVYRIEPRADRVVINILVYLQHAEATTSYEEKKVRLHRKYDEAPVTELQNAICDYGRDFHSRFIEDAIGHLHRFYVAGERASEYHSFYIKMLYYYDIMGVVSFANTAKKYIADLYKGIVVQSKRARKNDVAVIADTLARTGDTIPGVVATSYFDSVKRAEAVKPKTRKIEADLLPVGHFMGDVARFYSTERGWFDAPDYTHDEKKYRENDITIGYNEKSANSIHVRFKLREPVQSKSGDNAPIDTRLIRQGSICGTRSKAELADTAKKIGAKIVPEDSIDSLCLKIRTRLLFLEMKEREKGGTVRYFYQHWEDAKLPTS